MFKRHSNYRRKLLDFRSGLTVFREELSRRGGHEEQVQSIILRSSSVGEKRRRHGVTSYLKTRRTYDAYVTEFSTRPRSAPRQQPLSLSLPVSAGSFSSPSLAPEAFHSSALLPRQ